MIVLRDAIVLALIVCITITIAELLPATAGPEPFSCPRCAPPDHIVVHPVTVQVAP